MEIGSIIVAPSLPTRVESLANNALASIPTEYIRPEWECNQLGGALDGIIKSENGPQIPIINMMGFTSKDETEHVRCVETVTGSAKKWGVMHIVNHGIPLELIEKVREVGKGFFDLPVQLKEEYANQHGEGKIQGYSSKLANNKSRRLEWEDYFFHLIFPTDQVDLSIWPKEPVGYTEVMQEFAKQLRVVVTRMLSILSLGPGLEESKLEAELGGMEDLLLQMNINYSTTTPSVLNLILPLELRLTPMSALFPSSSTTMSLASKSSTITTGSLPNSSLTPSLFPWATVWKFSVTASTRACCIVD